MWNCKAAPFGDAQQAAKDMDLKNTSGATNEAILIDCRNLNLHMCQLVCHMYDCVRFKCALPLPGEAEGEGEGETDLGQAGRVLRSQMG